MIWARTASSYQLINLDSVARVAHAPAGTGLTFFGSSGQIIGESPAGPAMANPFSDLETILAQGVDGFIRLQHSMIHWTPTGPHRSPHIWMVTRTPLQLLNLSLAGKFEIPARPTAVQIFGPDNNLFATVNVCQTWPCLPAVAGQIWCCNSTHVTSETLEQRGFSKHNLLDARTQFSNESTSTTSPQRCFAYDFLDALERLLTSATAANRSGLINHLGTTNLGWVEPRPIGAASPH